MYRLHDNTIPSGIDHHIVHILHKVYWTHCSTHMLYMVIIAGIHTIALTKNRTWFGNTISSYTLDDSHRRCHRMDMAQSNLSCGIAML